MKTHLTCIFYLFTWEFNCKSYLYATMSSRTAFYLQQVNLMETPYSIRWKHTYSMKHKALQFKNIHFHMEQKDGFGEVWGSRGAN
jgi:hypothetical protein